MKKKSLPPSISDEAIFFALLKQEGVPLPVKEHRFHPTRKWRFDYAWIPLRLALEKEGAVWTAGRHTRPSGFLKDMEKYNTAASMLWIVLRTETSKLISKETISFIVETIHVLESHDRLLSKTTEGL